MPNGRGIQISARRIHLPQRELKHTEDIDKAIVKIDNIISLLQQTKESLAQRKEALNGEPHEGVETV
jgi:hypothetical protein